MGGSTPEIWALCISDGYIELRDRSKDIVISGGENISTIEVEGVLYKHPSVQDAAVVARPDEKWGETPCAFITLKPGVGDVHPDEIIEFCGERLAHFKVPKTVVFGELPKTSTGKVQKYCSKRPRPRALVDQGTLSWTQTGQSSSVPSVVAGCSALSSWPRSLPSRWNSSHSRA